MSGNDEIAARLRELSFTHSMQDAAKMLNIGLTTAKKKCRKFGIKKWPFRQIHSLEKLLNSLDNMQLSHADNVQQFVHKVCLFLAQYGSDSFTKLITISRRKLVMSCDHLYSS